MLIHSTIQYINRTIYIHLNDVKKALFWTVKLPGDVCTGYKYLITNLVVIVCPETIFPGIVGINKSLLSESDGFPIIYELEIEKHVTTED